MNNIERDKFLTEAMGECWHEFHHNIFIRKKIYVDYLGSMNIERHYFCIHCGKLIWEDEMSCLMDTDVNYLPDSNQVNIEKYDFSTPDGFFKLLNWLKENDYYLNFLNWNTTIDDIPYCSVGKSFKSGDFLNMDLIEPNVFANVVYQFLKEKDN